MLNDLRIALESSDYDYYNDSTIVEEGAKTNELHDIVNAYTTTIKEIDSKIKKAIKEKDYKTAEKYLLEKKKIVETIEQSVRKVEITASDNFKGNFGIFNWALPSVVRVSSWTRKLGGSKKQVAGATASLYLMYSILSLFPGGIVIFSEFKGTGYNIKNKLENARNHPSKTNLLSVITDTKEAIDKQIKKVRALQHAKKESFSAEGLFENMVREYMDTVLEGENCEDCDDEDIDDELEEFSLDIDMDDEL